MISSDLLDDLKKADPVLWERLDFTELAEVKYVDDHDNECTEYIYQEHLIDEAKEAWLQHCLQEAIRAQEGWHLCQLMSGDLPRFAEIVVLGHGKEHDRHFGAKGSTEAEALLKAYLAAIKETSST